MHYPMLIVNRGKLKYNIETMLRIGRDAGIDICAVTKVFCAHPGIAGIFVEAGAKILGDSRIQNLKKLAHLPVRKMMLRIPMISEAKEIVRYADVSLNSELKTIDALSQAAISLNKRHGVIIMVELGDLREGVMPEEVVDFAGKVLQEKGVQLNGVGANLNCYGGVLPTENNLSQLVSIARKIENEYNISLPIVSGGNSGSVYLMQENRMPKGINQLRLGETILRGCETSFQKRIDGLHQDVFTFRAEIVEIKVKPSYPAGEIGMDAFGNRPSYEDKGPMKRAILACGRQDVLFNHLSPLDEGVEFVGASSDHLIMDVTNAAKDYAIGDTMDFSIKYGALLAACTSEYVCKAIV